MNFKVSIGKFFNRVTQSLQSTETRNIIARANQELEAEMVAFSNPEQVERLAKAMRRDYALMLAGRPLGQTSRMK